MWSVLRTIPISDLRDAGYSTKIFLVTGERKKRQADRKILEDIVDDLNPGGLIAMALNGELGWRRKPMTMLEDTQDLGHWGRSAAIVALPLAFGVSGWRLGG